MMNELTVTPSSARVGTKPSLNGNLYDAALSTMWGVKRFTHFGAFFKAAPRMGFMSVELNHQVSQAMLDAVDLDGCCINSIHEPCPAVIPASELKLQDLLISSTDEGYRQKGVETIKRSIDLAHRLGARTIVVHAGQIQADWTIEKELHSLFTQGQADSDEFRALKRRCDEQRAWLVSPHFAAVKRSLAELLDYAGRFQVCLGIENRFHCFDIPGTDEMDELLSLAEPEQVGFVYDVGHAQVLDRLGFTPHQAWLERFANRIVGTHLHDVIGISDHRAPGTGEVDFRRVASHLPGEAFRTLEVSSVTMPEQIETGMKLLVDTGCIQRIH